MGNVVKRYAKDMDKLLKRGAGSDPDAFRAEVTRLSTEARAGAAGDSDRSIVGMLATCAENVAGHPECYAAWRDLAEKQLGAL